LIASLGPNPIRCGLDGGVDDGGVPSILAITSVAVACMGDTPPGRSLGWGGRMGIAGG
jgi:hypothetical protein